MLSRVLALPYRLPAARVIASAWPQCSSAPAYSPSSQVVVLMLPKTWRDPGSETPSSFVLAGVAGVLGTVAVGAVDPSLLLYPGYFGAVNAGLAGVILLRRRFLQLTVPVTDEPSNA